MEKSQRPVKPENRIVVAERTAAARDTKTGKPLSSRVTTRTPGLTAADRAYLRPGTSPRRIAKKIGELA
jgi:hypothetical protein